MTFEFSLSRANRLLAQAQRERWAVLEPLLLARLSAGDMLVVDEVAGLQEAAVPPDSLREFVRVAIAREAQVVLASQVESDFQRSVLPSGAHRLTAPAKLLLEWDRLADGWCDVLNEARARQASRTPRTLRR